MQAKKFKIVVQNTTDKPYSPPLPLPEGLHVNLNGDQDLIVEVRNEDQQRILDTWFQKYKYRVKLVELEEKPEPLFLKYLKDIKSLEYDTADDDLEVSLRLHFSLVLADEFLKVYEKIGMVIDAGLTEEQQQNSIKYFEQTVDQMVDNSVYCIKGFTDIITEAVQKVFPKSNQVAETGNQNEQNEGK